MRKELDGIGFNKSLAVSILIHASLFLVLKNPPEQRRIYFSSHIPVTLVNVSIPAPKKEVKKPAPKKVKPKKKPKGVNIKKAKKNPVKTEVKKKTPQKQEQKPQAPKQTAIKVAPGFCCPWYLGEIERSINHNWTRPDRMDELVGKKAVVFFRIDRAGGMSRVELEKQSGDVELDSSGLRAIKIMETEGFPPLPTAYEEDFLNVHYHFEIY